MSNRAMIECSRVKYNKVDPMWSVVESGRAMVVCSIVK